MVPYFQWTTISLGPLTIQVWGLFVSLGMALSLVIIVRRGKRLGMPPEQLLDRALWMIAAGFIVARLFHIFLYEPAFYLANPIEMLKIWHGGLSSFGGVVGAIIGFFGYGWKRRSKHSLLEIADIFSFASVFGWIVGRIGCFMIHDHLGVHSSCPLAMQMTDLPGVAGAKTGGSRLDMALLEILSLLPLAIIFFLVRKRLLRSGWYTAVLFIYYGIVRFILDFWRARDIIGADVRYFGLTPGQYGAIVMVAIGLYIQAKKYRKHNGGA